MKSFITLLSLYLCSAVSLCSSVALACPPVHNIPDYNCDGELHIVFLGDSLVYGTGDEKNGGSGGYVLRARKRLKSATLHNFGVPGQQTRALLKELDDTFGKNSDNPEMRDALRIADIVVLDEGRNDRWLFGPPIQTYRNIKRARKIVTSKVRKSEGYPPFIITSVLMLPNRGSQGPWVAELNDIIRSRSTRKFPSNLRFDKVSKTLLSEDQIHPSSAGYEQLTKKLVRYLKKRGRKYMKKLRPDTDKDNLPDTFEESRFMTDPLLADTDGDGYTDGEELFTLMTDPLSISEMPEETP